MIDLLVILFLILFPPILPPIQSPTAIPPHTTNQIHSYSISYFYSASSSSHPPLTPLLPLLHVFMKLHSYSSPCSTPTPPLTPLLLHFLTPLLLLHLLHSCYSSNPTPYYTPTLLPLFHSFSSPYSTPAPPIYHFWFSLYSTPTPPLTPLLLHPLLHSYIFPFFLFSWLVLHLSTSCILNYDGLSLFSVWTLNVIRGLTLLERVCHVVTRSISSSTKQTTSISDTNRYWSLFGQ